MPRTNVPITTASLNGSADPGAGTALDPTNGHVVADPRDVGKLILLVNNTAAAAKNITVRNAAVASQNEGGRPLAEQGSLVVSVPASGWRVIGPFESARFKGVGADAGDLLVDVEAAATGTIRAIALP